MNIRFEYAKTEDAQALLGFLKVVGGESDNLTFGAEGLPFSVEEEAAYIESMNQNGNLLLLAKYEDRIVGNVSISRFPRRMSHRAELGITVLKAEWGKGIGRELMRQAIEHAKAQGLEIISLEVRSDNVRAIRLYEKCGFQKIGTFPGSLKINGQLIDFDIMILHL